TSHPASYTLALHDALPIWNDIVSQMPRDNRSFFYPSVSLGFVLTEIPAIQNATWLSFAKLRASYAEVGQAGRYLENFYTTPGYRSEEHTSELQSRENLVCR